MESDFSCPICGDPCADGHERADHLSNDHDLIARLEEAEFNQ